jgi:hypothetical protein
MGGGGRAGMRDGLESGRVRDGDGLWSWIPGCNDIMR